MKHPLKIGVLSTLIGCLCAYIGNNLNTESQLLSWILIAAVAFISAGAWFITFRQVKAWQVLMFPLAIVYTAYALTGYNNGFVSRLTLLIVLTVATQLFLWRPFPQSMVAFAFAIFGVMAIGGTFLHIISPQATNKISYTQECHGIAVLALIVSVFLVFLRRLGMLCANVHIRVKLTTLWTIAVAAGGLGFMIFVKWLDHQSPYGQDGFEVLALGFWMGLLSCAAFIDAYSLGKNKPAIEDTAESLP